MHNENNYSYVQVGNLGDPGWSSAQWLLQQQSSSTVASIRTGINEQKVAQLCVYPNPSPNGIFTIDLRDINSDNDKLTIFIIDLNGKIVFQKQAISGHEIELNTSLTNGIYFLKIVTSTESIVQKIIVL